MPLLSLSNAIPATTGSGGRYTRPLAALRGREVSGIYAIFDQETGERLYVGESHTGRLFDTITRHFRAWKRTDRGEGVRRGGTTYNRDRVSVAWLESPADAAQAAQYKEIQDTNPRDNEPDGSTAYTEQNPPARRARATRWNAARRGAATGKSSKATARIEVAPLGEPLALIYRHKNGRVYRHNWPTGAINESVLGFIRSARALVILNSPTTTRNGQPFIK